MQRRQLLSAIGAGSFAALAGCDRLVVLDPEADRELTPITPIGTFYVYQYDAMPEFDPETHVMRVTFEGEELGSLTAADLATVPVLEREQTLQCIGHSPRIVRIGNAVWGGQPLIDIFDGFGIVPPKNAVDLRLEGMDGYDAGVPVTDLYDAPIWLVWQMNGEPLPFEHGAPARLLVPGKYGVKNLKWIREIAFTTSPHASYWTQFGWSEEARYRPNTLIVSPFDGLVLEEGLTVGFVGSAYAGQDPIVAVEVRVDEGEWESAALDYAPGPGIWAVWSWSWRTVPGDHFVQVRCRTASGAVSDEDPRGTDVLMGYDGSMQITVTV
ncbi:MAG: molybdopterin-dependent oxidoreductase [Myxococcota bacterium]